MQRNVVMIHANPHDGLEITNYRCAQFLVGVMRIIYADIINNIIKANGVLTFTPTET